jgi:PGF-pre-PGF domain-containing protein
VTVTDSNTTSVQAAVEVNETDTDSKSTAVINANVESEDGSVKAETIGIETANSGGGYTASVTASSESSTNTPTEKTLGTVEVGHSVSDSEILEASFVVGVSRDRLADTTLENDDITLYRLHNGEWTQLATSHVRTDDGVEMFRATSPGLSTFAIANKSGEGANIQNVTISDTTVFQNDKVRIHTTLRNPTNEQKTHTLDIQVGDDTDSKEVSVQAESGKTVTHLKRIGDNVGGVNKEVFVNGVYAGTLEVQRIPSTLEESANQQTTTSEQTPTETGSDSQTAAPVTTTGSSGPGFTVALTLFVAVILTFAALTRR